jgi:hypothetical protein
MEIVVANIPLAQDNTAIFTEWIAFTAYLHRNSGRHRQFAHHPATVDLSSQFLRIDSHKPT